MKLVFDFIVHFNVCSDWESERLELSNVDISNLDSFEASPSQSVNSEDPKKIQYDLTPAYIEADPSTVPMKVPQIIPKSKGELVFKNQNVRPISTDTLPGPSSAVDLTGSSAKVKSQIELNRKYALLRNTKCRRMKNVIGSYKCQGQNYRKVRDVYQTIYEEEFDYEILVSLLVTGQVIINPVIQNIFLQNSAQWKSLDPTL